ncbi:MAG: proline--tRNA ligase [Candidatus Omnitrophica bacterium]|nr:proline--tRNA ligase [Candidatus Omnitrophota bacterium]
MLYSKFFIPTLREDPHSAECVSHRLLLRGGCLFMASSGIYSYLPLGLRILNKISNIIRKHMNAEGAAELFMSHLQPMEIWQKTGRDKDLSEVMIKFKDRKGRDLCLGPTHEEEITEIAKRYLSSYKQLPVILYQIQSKFRDEFRPRCGLIRSCEFIMKDAYSFDADEEGLEENYSRMLDAYNRIFKECDLSVVVATADSGVMGGSTSHEFMAPADIGEDVLFYCSKCDNYFREQGCCDKCKNDLNPKKMIELGHVFKLGTKYSKAQEAYFLNKEGKRCPFIMGCYGIGVSRIISAVVEQSHDEKGIIWPNSLAPFELNLVILDLNNKELLEQALEVEAILRTEGLTVLIDDRDEPAGVKFNDAYLLGIPYILILGKKFLNTGKFELERRKTGEKFSFSKQELIKYLKDDY